MSSISHQYEMEAGSSRMLEACHEPSVLIETVDTIVGDNGVQGEKYFVVTEVDGGQTDLVEISGVEKLDGDNSIEESQPWAEICRVCANSSDHLIPIFEGEGLEHEISSKIQRYLPIQVCENDSLPIHLCYHCAATLLAWHELVDGCLDAEQRLLRMQTELEQKHQADVMGESLDDGDGALTTDESHVSIKDQLSEEELVVKGECNEELATTDSERFKNCTESPPSSSFTHFRRAYRALLRSYETTVKPPCQSVSKNKNRLKVVSTDNGTNNQSPEDTNDRTHLPEERLISTIVLQNNVTNISNDENIASNIVNSKVIAEAFRHPIILENHTSLIAVDSSTPDTSKEESSQGGIDSVAELPSVSAIASYDCKLCGKIFLSQETLRAHMRVHADAKRFTCHICGKQFGQTGSLYYHLKHVHGGVKQHSCDICGRSFAMKAAMEDHRRIHTGERPYCCASCGKTFKTKASLYIHSKTHTDELPHKCSYCPKAFRWRQQMLGHLTIHTGQKNHVCDICGKRFGVKNDLTRHKRIHSEDKPFMCQQCGLSFGQKRYLKNHEKTRHR